MSCPKKLLSKNNVLLLFLTSVLCACGVKGDPMPPEKPTQLGRGRPTYRRATEGIKLQKHQPVEEPDEDEVNESKEKRDDGAN